MASKKRSQSTPRPKAEVPTNTEQSEGSEPSFEESVERLEAIVSRLESGELSLEQSLKLFEEGVSLARTSQKQLDATEKRLDELLAVDESGTPIVQDLLNAPELLADN